MSDSLVPGAQVLAVEQLGKVYGNLRAVSDLSFSLQPGEVLGLVGPNGAGKTTTLRCLSGIIPATSGRVTIGGADLGTAPVQAKQQLAFLPDEPKLFEYLTAWEHLNLIARLYGVEGWEPKGRALFTELELSGKETSLPGELSRGMKQKLSIACAFLHEPRLIVLDEPLTGLDPLGIRKMKASLRARAQAGAAMVLSSHLLPLVEELCTKLLIISGGKRVAYGTLEEIRQSLGGGEASLEELFVQITSSATA